MLYTITVLDFTSGSIKIYKNVDLKDIDAEEWLSEVAKLDMDNCQWMSVPAEQFKIETENVQWPVVKYKN